MECGGLSPGSRCPSWSKLEQATPAKTPHCPGCSSSNQRLPSPEMNDFVQRRRMSAQQEVANALSMMVPAAWVLTSWRCWGGALTLRSCLLVSSICCHMPLSVYYHMRVALSKMGVWRLSCTLDNTPRRLDQTGILLITSIAAYALSADHLLFAVCACAFNAHAILLLWQREMAPRRNQRDAIISATLIVWPMVRRCDWANFATAVAYALPGVYCFAQYPFGCALALCTPRSPTSSPCAPQQHPSGHTLTPCALLVCACLCAAATPTPSSTCYLAASLMPSSPRAKAWSRRSSRASRSSPFDSFMPTRGRRPTRPSLPFGHITVCTRD